jgi:hypothetical protein
MSKEQHGKKTALPVLNFLPGFIQINRDFWDTDPGFFDLPRVGGRREHKSAGFQVRRLYVAIPSRDFRAECQSWPWQRSC